MDPSPTEAIPAEAIPAEQVQALRTEVWRYLRFLGCDREAASDLSQEAFAQLLARGAAFEPRSPRATLGWLRAAARNLFLASLRHRGQALDATELDVADAVWDEGAGGQREAYLAALERCIQKLPPRSRQILAMRYDDGQGREAIAAAIGRSAEAVKTLLRRIREELRRCVHREESRDVS